MGVSVISYILRQDIRRSPDTRLIAVQEAFKPLHAVFSGIFSRIPGTRHTAFFSLTTRLAAPVATEAGPQTNALVCTRE